MLKEDLEFVEAALSPQQKRMDLHFQNPQIYKHSITILEIGAGPVQPLARELAELFLQNDKYRCCLIRINPVRERRS